MDARQGHGGVAAVVARRRLRLLVGGVLLLVDDHQPQVPEGEEERGAGAEDDGGAALAERFGGPPAGDGGLAGVEDMQPGAETGPQDLLQAVAEGRLRTQDERLVAGVEDLAQGWEVSVPPAVAREDERLARGRFGRRGSGRPAQAVDLCAQRVALGGEPGRHALAVPAREVFLLLVQAGLQPGEDVGGRLLAPDLEVGIGGLVDFSERA